MELLSVGAFSLDGPEAHHLAHVRRLAVGDEVILFNGDGNEYRAVVVSIRKRQVDLEIKSIDHPERELGFRLHIASALPKGDRLDFLIEKLTELGVTDFTPLIAERSVVIAKEAKIEKLQRAVVESSKQSGRNVLMRIHSPQTSVDWFAAMYHPTEKWIADPSGEAIGAPKIISDGVAITIGPEGGFTPEEQAAASRAGFRAIRLGPRILRIETAALACTVLAIGSLHS